MKKSRGVSSIYQGSVYGDAKTLHWVPDPTKKKKKKSPTPKSRKKVAKQNTIAPTITPTSSEPPSYQELLIEIPTVSGSAKFLTIPVPTEKQRADIDGLMYVNREGQSEFREKVLEAYKKCAVTGCEDKGALQAAHIIPYVDADSNEIINGLCLRADIHCLYDRNLIKIDGSYVTQVARSVRTSEYQSYDGAKIQLPQSEADWPHRKLLSVRHRYVVSYD